MDNRGPFDPAPDHGDSPFGGDYPYAGDGGGANEGRYSGVGPYTTESPYVSGVPGPSSADTGTGYPVEWPLPGESPHPGDWTVTGDAADDGEWTEADWGPGPGAVAAPDATPLAESAAAPVAAPAQGRDGASMSMMTMGVTVLVTVVLLFVGVGIAVWLRGGDSDPVAAEPQLQADESAGGAQQGDANPVADNAPAPTGDAGRSGPAPTREAGRTSTATPTVTTTQARTDLGTGRGNVDERGWVGSYARCDSRDLALAVLEVHDSSGDPMKTVACETSGGSRYYRGTSTAGDLEIPVVADDGTRITARNGSWEYLMSPSGLRITENGSLQYDFPASTWGRA